MGIQARHISTPSRACFKPKMHPEHDWGEASFSSLSLCFRISLPLASCLKSSILITVDRANIVIIGGGVVGCAVARAVSQRWSDVFLVEQMPKLGMGASTRNSGVIHSGIYYPPGSLKSRLCVAGNRMLYEFCATHRVPHRNCGKL